MQLSIPLRRSHPVTIAQLALLYSCRHGAIHLYLHILLAVPYVVNGCLYRLAALLACWQALRVFIRMRKDVFWLVAVACCHIIHIEVWRVFTNGIASRFVRLIIRF